MIMNKCKKAIKLLAGIFCNAFLLILTGCAGCYKGYTGNTPDLYTVAINSVLWNKGHSDQSDKYCDSEIKVLEEDKFGRILYTYYEDYYVGDTISFSSLIVSQYSVDGYVYYYEDCNYLIKEQEANTHVLNDFSQKEIDNLKKANDWGKEIDLSKCIKKQIVRNKQGVPTDTKAIESKVIERLNVKNGLISIDYLTSDTNGNFILYGVVCSVGKQDDYFVAFANSGGNIVDWLVPQDLYAYQEELKNFKLKNGWVSQEV